MCSQRTKEKSGKHTQQGNCMKGEHTWTKDRAKFQFKNM